VNTSKPGTPKGSGTPKTGSLNASHTKPPEQPSQQIQEEQSRRLQTRLHEVARAQEQDSQETSPRVDPPPENSS
jgi:hypothetical protein